MWQTITRFINNILHKFSVFLFAVSSISRLFRTRSRWNSQAKWNTRRTQYIIIYLHLCHAFDEGAKNMRMKFRFAQDARRGAMAILLLPHRIFLLKSIMYIQTRVFSITSDRNFSRTWHGLPTRSLIHSWPRLLIIVPRTINLYQTRIDLFTARY